MTKPNNTVIAAYSRSDAEALHTLLNQYAPHIDVTAICTESREVEQYVKQFKAHTLFLDIELASPEPGFYLLERIQDLDLDIIFTATRPNSVQINSLIALNKKRHTGLIRFLFKPVDAKDLAEVLDDICKRSQEDMSALSSNVRQEVFAESFRPKWIVRRGNEDHLWFHKGPKNFIPIHTIHYCKADGNYVQVFFENGGGFCSRQLLRCTIGFLSNLLEPYQFFRTHASYLVNLQRIDAQNLSLVNGQTGSGGCITVKNWDDTHYNGVIPLARSKKQAFLSILAELGIFKI